MSFFNTVQTWGRELSYEAIEERKFQLLGLGVVIFILGRFIFQVRQQAVSIICSRLTIHQDTLQHFPASHCIDSGTMAR